MIKLSEGYRAGSRKLNESSSITIPIGSIPSNRMQNILRNARAMTSDGVKVTSGPGEYTITAPANVIDRFKSTYSDILTTDRGVVFESAMVESITFRDLQLGTIIRHRFEDEDLRIVGRPRSGGRYVGAYDADGSPSNVDHGRDYELDFQVRPASGGNTTTLTLTANDLNNGRVVIVSQPTNESTLAEAPDRRFMDEYNAYLRHYGIHKRDFDYAAFMEEFQDDLLGGTFDVTTSPNINESFDDDDDDVFIYVQDGDDAAVIQWVKTGPFWNPRIYSGEFSKSFPRLRTADTTAYDVLAETRRGNEYANTIDFYEVASEGGTIDIDLARQFAQGRRRSSRMAEAIGRVTVRQDETNINAFFDNNLRKTGNHSYGDPEVEGQLEDVKKFVRAVNNQRKKGGRDLPISFHQIKKVNESPGYIPTGQPVNESGEPTVTNRQHWGSADGAGVTTVTVNDDGHEFYIVGMNAFTDEYEKHELFQTEDKNQARMYAIQVANKLDAAFESGMLNPSHLTFRNDLANFARKLERR